MGWLGTLAQKHLQLPVLNSENRELDARERHRILRAGPLDFIACRREGNPAAALLSAGGGRVDPYIRAVQAWKADFMRVASGKAPVDGAINMPMPTVLVGMGVR